MGSQGLEVEVLGVPLRTGLRNTSFWSFQCLALEKTSIDEVAIEVLTSAEH